MLIINNTPHNLVFYRVQLRSVIHIVTLTWWNKTFVVVVVILYEHF